MFVYNDTIAMYSDLMRLSLVEIPQHFLTENNTCSLKYYQNSAERNFKQENGENYKKKHHDISHKWYYLHVACKRLYGNRNLV